MGLDRPIKLFLIFTFASVSMAAIRHLWSISAILLNRPSGTKLRRSGFSSSMGPGTLGVRPNTHCLGLYPLCCTRLFYASVSSSSIVLNSLCDTSISSTILYPMCRKYLAFFHLSHLPMCFSQCWFHKYASSFCLVEETSGYLRPVGINSKTSWASSPSQPSCRESSPDGLGSMISNLNRNVHT